MDVATLPLNAREILNDPATSDWLKEALKTTMIRDPVDALNDVLALAGVLEEHLRNVLDLDEAN